MAVTHDERQLRLRVSAMVWEAEGVLSLGLRTTDGSPLPVWRPGAHVDVRLPRSLTRQYSLCGSPADGSTWRIAVLHEKDGRGGSAAVHEELRPGDVLDVVGPRNTFALRDAPEYVFIAGGIGITPILPMVAAAATAGARWRLFYGGRHRPGMAFLDELTSYGDAVTVWPQDEHGLIDLEAALGTPRPDALVYACGPGPLLAAVRERCLAWPEAALRMERFAADPSATTAGQDEAAFEIRLHRSGRTVSVPPGRTVLEALEGAGLTVPNSCREGICGTCETKVLGGVPDHRDSLLSDEEKAANDTMMICVGRALTPSLDLDL